MAIETWTQGPDVLHDDPVWVREPLPAERPIASHGRTGDVLPDGSVLLRQEDMNRMGLDRLREWILRNVQFERPIVIAGASMEPGRTVHDLT